jgi:hypothetical protein
MNGFFTTPIRPIEVFALGVMVVMTVIGARVGAGRGEPGACSSYIVL